MSTEQPIPVLDDQVRMRSVDKKDMLRLIQELPEQYETAIGIGRSFAVEPPATRPNVVYITAAGDSCIAADMVAATVGEEMSVPVVADHGGRIPAYIDEGSLVFIMDYSGKSQSALRNYREARLRKATVICVTSGGRLHEAVSKDGGKILRIPPGQPARSAIGYLYAPVPIVIEQLGLASGAIERLSQAVRLLKSVRESFRASNPTTRNPAKQLALALADKLPIIYGVADYRAAVANRWKNSLGANSKQPAFAGLLNDVAESEISAWESTERTYPPVAIILLTDAADKITEQQTLVSASKEMLERFDPIEVEMRGGTSYEKLLYGTYLGDYVSYYLAIVYGINPTITEYATHIADQLEA